MISRRILVVDDSPTLIAQVRSALADHYSILEAVDGEQGLISALKNRPDLVILDVEMPKMRGWEVCKLLKSNRLTEKIPVLMLTSKSEIGDYIVAMQQGADDYLTKPFVPDDLVERVRRLLPG
jgi:two-component system, OmpR family, alkaline phosphatase synthesis response regulator PhoP